MYLLKLGNTADIAIFVKRFSKSRWKLSGELWECYLYWPLFLQHFQVSIYSKYCCQSQRWHSKICSYFRLYPGLTSLTIAIQQLRIQIKIVSLMRNYQAELTYLHSFLLFTCKGFLVIFHSRSFCTCALLWPNPVDSTNTPPCPTVDCKFVCNLIGCFISRLKMKRKPEFVLTLNMSLSFLNLVRHKRSISFLIIRDTWCIWWCLFNTWLTDWQVIPVTPLLVLDKWEVSSLKTNLSLFFCKVA